MATLCLITRKQMVGHMIHTTGKPIINIIRQGRVAWTKGISIKTCPMAATKRHLIPLRNMEKELNPATYTLSKAWDSKLMNRTKSSIDFRTRTGNNPLQVLTRPLRIKER